MFNAELAPNKEILPLSPLRGNLNFQSGDSIRIECFNMGTHLFVSGHPGDWGAALQVLWITISSYIMDLSG